MKLTLMIGVFAVLLLCVVEETSAHASNSNANDILDRGLTDAERKERRKNRIAKKKNRQGALEK